MHVQACESEIRETTVSDQIEVGYATVENSPPQRIFGHVRQD